MAIDIKELARIVETDPKIIRDRYDIWRQGRKGRGDKIDLDFLARMTGLSSASVSNFLNKKKGSLSREKALRLEKLIALVGYVPSGAAQLLGKIKKMTLGYVAPVTTSASTDFYIEVLKGVKELCRDYGYSLNIYDVSTEHESRFYAQMPFLGLVDGLISVSSKAGAEDLAPLAGKNIPIVQVNPYRKMAGKPVTHILISDTGGFKSLVIHMLKDHQCRTPVIVTSDPEKYYQRRELVSIFTGCLRECGLSFKPSKQIHIVPSYSILDGRECLNNVRKKLPAVDCFICLSDVTATAVAAECGKHGLSIPITGYANMPIATLFDLTTVDQNLTELGKAAFERIFFALQYREVNNTFPPHEEIVFPSRFVKRHSCKCQINKTQGGASGRSVLFYWSWAVSFSESPTPRARMKGRVRNTSGCTIRSASPVPFPS